MKTIIALLLIGSAGLLQGCAYPEPAKDEQNDARPAIGVSGAPEGSNLYVDGLAMGATAQYDGEAGVLLVAPTEGEYLEVDQLIAQTDDTDAKWAAKASEYAVAALQKDLESEIRLEYSKASREVRRVAYEKAQRANQITPGAIPDIELRELEFQYKEARLSFENTLHERAITEINLSEKNAEWQRTLALMERHKVLSPIRGIVAEVEKRKGEYVRPGDPVARLVQLDRVRISAKLNPSDYAMDAMVGRNVRITIDIGGSGRTETFEGVIAFADPELDASGRFEVWAEIDVPNENLRDGMQGTMEFI